jgi:hypothetical protein
MAASYAVAICPYLSDVWIIEINIILCKSYTYSDFSCKNFKRKTVLILSYKLCVFYTKVYCGIDD